MIHRFRPLGERELAGVRAGVEAALARWSAQWISGTLPALKGVNPSRVGAGERPSDRAEWRDVEVPGVEPVLVSWYPGFARSLELALLPGSAANAGNSVAAEVVDRALTELAVLLAGREAVEDGNCRPQPTEACTRLWRSGWAAVDVSLELDRSEVLFVLSRQHVQQWVGPEKPLPKQPRLTNTRGDALGRVTVPVEVVLHETGLTVADIRRLQPKDVVMFDHPISRPVRLRVRGGGELGWCYLGRTGDRRAVKLVKAEG